MAEWQRVLLLAVLACYATAQSPQSAEPATLKVSFVINVSVTSCSNSAAELEAIKGIIANVVAATASKPHRNYPVLVDVSTCASTSVSKACCTAFTRVHHLAASCEVHQQPRHCQLNCMHAHICETHASPKPPLRSSSSSCHRALSCGYCHQRLHSNATSSISVALGVQTTVAVHVQHMHAKAHAFERLLACIAYHHPEHYKSVHVQVQLYVH
jgi:hypothetical protein